MPVGYGLVLGLCTHSSIFCFSRRCKVSTFCMYIYLKFKLLVQTKCLLETDKVFSQMIRHIVSRLVLAICFNFVTDHCLFKKYTLVHVTRGLCSISHVSPSMGMHTFKRKRLGHINPYWDLYCTTRTGSDKVHNAKILSWSDAQNGCWKDHTLYASFCNILANNSTNRQNRQKILELYPSHCKQINKICWI